MYSMRRFMQAQVLLIILAVLGMRTADKPLVSLVLAGMLMLLFTVKSLEEKASTGIILVQYLLSMAFCLSTADFLSFLLFGIFHVDEYKKKRYWGLLMPAIVYVITAMIAYGVSAWKVSMPLVLLGTLVLFLLSGVLWLVEYLIMKYVTAERQNRDVLRVAAINELVDKKLKQELLVKNYLREKNGRLEERENISRNIHNSVGHSITAAIMTLDAADMLYDTAPEKARERMNTANARMREGLAAVRHAVRVLDEDNVYLVMEDLINNFATVVEQFTMDTVIRVLTDWETVDKAIAISREHTEYLTGALQELLTNGVKHGAADRFVVHLVADSSHVRLSVQDNGKSDFAAVNQKERIEKGFGLKKLYSYAQRCGGDIAILAAENGQGLRVEVTLPLEKERDDEAVSYTIGG